MKMKFRTSRLAVCLPAAMLLYMVAPVAAHGQEHALLTRHVRDAVMNGQAQLVGPLPAWQSLRLNIALPLRNQAELNTFLQQLYDPQNPAYHQFLSVGEFTERFGPSQEDYDAVIRFLEANGAVVTGTAANRMLVNVTAPVASIEQMFHVTLNVYQDPAAGRTFYAPDREPTVDLAAPLWHVTGLDNYSIPHPASLTRDPAATIDATGSGPGGNFLGSDMRKAYYGGSSLTGAGQSLGLVEFAGYNIADVNLYFSKVGQTRRVTVVGVSTDGSSLNCTGRCDDSEQVLDIEQAISMAPGMHQVRVYVSDTSDVAIFNSMASENLAKSLSCSWGWSPADTGSDDPIFMEFAAQGQNLFTASGDSGAYGKRSRNVYPADDAYLTSVGGTDLTTNGAGGAWKSETGWRSSGGGISPNKIPIPSYQKLAGVITTGNKGSTTYRNSPDVAAEANTDNYICADGSCSGGWGGTSFAAPRWAGYLALANQQSVAHGEGPIGFINPTLYTTGLGGNHAANFHDITSGSNRTYTAIKGFDLVTGWGSPNKSGLINTLAP
jgi:subtilase family serine protease